MRPTSFARPIPGLLLATLLVAPACSSGGGGSSSSGSRNDDSLVSDFAVTGTKGGASGLEPARIHFTLTDRNGDDVPTALWFRKPGGPQVLIDARNRSASPTGNAHAYEWRFAELEQEFPPGEIVPDVLVFLEITGEPRQITPENSATVTIGNQPPAIALQAVSGGAVIEGEVSLPFLVSDSTGDFVNVAIEYLATGSSAWEPAACAGGCPRPDRAFVDVIALPEEQGGSSRTFRWDVEQHPELAGARTEVVLRARAFDKEHGGSSAEELVASPFAFTPPFTIDNNGNPRLALFDGYKLASQDERGGIPVVFELADDESHPAGVLFQWTRPGEPFEAFGETPQAIEALLRDPAERARLRVCEELPTFLEGRIGRLPPGASAQHELRLRGLESSAAGLFARSRAGRPLELLRTPRGLAELDWDAGIHGPAVAIQPLRASLRLGARRDGVTALYLAQPNGAWELLEVDLTSGESASILSHAGIATALSVHERSRTAYVAALISGQEWAVARVDLAAATLSEVTGGTTLASGVRGLLARGDRAALATVDSSLLRVDFDSGTASALLDGLQLPCGLAPVPAHPDEVFLAETQADRVLVVDLGSATTRRLIAFDPSEPVPLREPRALALEELSRLLVVSVGAGGSGLLRAVPLGAGYDLDSSGAGIGDPYVTTLESGLDPFAWLASGPDDLVVVSKSIGGGPQVAGGVAGRLTLSAQAPLNPQRGTATVVETLSAQPAAGTPWRIPLGGMRRYPSSPGGIRHQFVWDTRAVGPGGSLLLRAIPFDAELGSEARAASGKTVAVGLRERDRHQEDAPFSQVIGDLDRDGDDDLVALEDGVAKVYKLLEPGRLSTMPTHILGAGVLGTAQKLVLADVNGDGLLDICATTNDGTPRLSVYQQATGDTFQLVQFTLGAAVDRLDAAVDWNGDHAVDFLARRQQGGVTTARTLIRDGSGFTHADTGVQGFAFAAGDLDGDGLQDLVSQRVGSPSCLIEVFLQNAAGGFDPGFGGPYDFGEANCFLGDVEPLLVRDLDADGRTDVVAAFGFDRLAVLFGRSSEFEHHMELPLIGGSQGVELVGLAIHDVDGNGLIDVGATTRGSGGSGGGLVVHYQARPREFVANPLGRLAIDFEEGVDGLAFGEFSADAKPDVLVLEYPFSGTAERRLYVQEPSGGFELAEALSILEIDVRPSGLALADMDRDGDRDIVFVDRITNELVLVRQNAPGLFDASGETRVSWADHPQYGAPRTPVAGDVDGDGDIDVVVVHPSTGNLSLLRQVGRVLVLDPGFGFAVPGSFQNPRVVVLDDLDGDGLVDLLCSESDAQDDHRVSIWHRDGAGYDRNPSVLESPFPVARVQVVDLDSDSFPDVIVSHAFASAVHYQEPQSGFGASVFSAPLDLGAYGRIGVGDLDGDGDLDLAAGHAFGLQVDVLEQQAPRSFQVIAELVLSAPDDPSASDLFWTRVDGDRLADIVTRVENVQSLSGCAVFKQVTAGRFARDLFADPGDLTIWGSTGSSLLADMDGDGDDDLVTTTGDALIVLFGGY